MPEKISTAEVDKNIESDKQTDQLVEKDTKPADTKTE